jgi:hypothetical protein
VIHKIYIYQCHRLQLKSRLPSTQLKGILYVTDDDSSLVQRLRKSYNAIYSQRVCNDLTMNTDCFRLLMDTVQDSGAAIADRVKSMHGTKNNSREF